MRTTLTVRAAPELLEAISKRADAQGKTVSGVVREILEAAFQQRPVRDRVGHLKGRLELPRSRESWASSLRQRNWRP